MVMSFCGSVWMYKHGLDVYSNEPAVAALINGGHYAHVIPGYCYNTTKALNGYEIHIDISKDGLPDFSISDDLRLVILKGRFHSFAEANTLPYLIHYLLEVQRNRAGQVTVKGAAVAKKGKGVLLLGKSGAGKTTMCISMCREHGYQLVGNNTVIAGLKDQQGYLYGGEEVIRMRLSTVRYYNRDLLRLFSKETGDADEWSTTRTVLPEELDIPVAQGISSIQAVLMLHLVDDVSAPLHIGELDIVFSRLYLYEVVSQYIRGITTPMLVGKEFSYGTYLPPLDSVELHHKRIQLVHWMISQPNDYYVSGPVDKIVQYIDQLVIENTNG